MIVDVIIVVLVTCMTVVQALFAGITYFVPIQIVQAFQTFFSYTSVGNGLFPMSDILGAIFSVLGLWITLYIIKIFLFGFSVIPWIGKVLRLPEHTTTNISQATSSTTFDDNGKPHTTVNKFTGNRTVVKRTRTRF